MLLFYSSAQRYACSTKNVLEIIPFVELQKNSQQKAPFVGAVNYGGLLCPVLDWGLLVEDAATSHAFNSRIILVSSDGEEPQLGILAARVTETKELDPGAFVPTAESYQLPEFFGGVLTDSEGTIHYVDIEKVPR